jgi:hypothetical protein
MVRRT